MSQLPDKTWQARYPLQKVLAESAETATYRVQGPDGTPCILKELRVAHLSDWKRLELFEREAQTLKHLQHPDLPRLLDFFKDADETHICLVLEEMPGRSLLEWLQSGWRPHEAEAIDIARQVLKLLHHLHQHHPPIIHRDLKPSNILREDNGHLSLIDLGAAQHLLHPEGGRTVVGTFGYMAPEQFSGHAGPGSDLYALGASLVHLLSGRSPAELPLEGMRLNFEPYLRVSPELSHWLRRMLDPDPQQRFGSATAALQALENPQQPPFPPPSEAPLTSRVKKPWMITTGLGCGLLLLGGIYMARSGPPDSLRHPPPPPQAAAAACFTQPLLHTPPERGPQAEAFRADFTRRFPLPATAQKLSVPQLSTLDELSTLWRCQPQRSGDDLAFFKAAHQLVLHSPGNDEAVANAISLMSSSLNSYPQRKALLAFGVEHYADVVSTRSWEEPGTTAAWLVLHYSEQLNRQREYPEAIKVLSHLLNTRSSEINDHMLQLLSHEYALALWKAGETEQALKVLDTALTQYKQGDWQAKLQKLRDQISA